MNSGGFIAVHVGAGYHSPANSELYEKVCKTACQKALNVLKNKQSALEAVTAATVALEDSPWTNAGFGSNLNISGMVECDASVMDGRSLHYGAVGAVPGVKNPICVAESLLKTQMQGVMSLGRIPPSTLAGAGAREWAKKNGIPVTQSENLLTDASKRAFIKHKRKLNMLEDEQTSQDSRKSLKLEEKTSRGDSTTDGQSDGQSDRLLDTVGAVCVDGEGRICSTASSGGIVLKQPGRLGQAALYGCGCWAECDSSTNTGIGICTSGGGEHLTKTLLAKECVLSLQREEDAVKGIAQTFQKKFLDSPFLKDLDQKLGGVLAVRTLNQEDNSRAVEVLWAHTTDSMCLAYMSTEDQQPTAFISRLPEGTKCGKSCIVQCKQIQLPQT